MGTLFRSETMVKCQMFIQREAAYECISALGETGVAEFNDLNPEMNAFQRQFVSEVRRGDEMERRLNYIESEVVKDEIEIAESDNSPMAPNAKTIIELEMALEKAEMEVIEMSRNEVTLRSNYQEMVEIKHVLEKTDVFFTEQESGDFGRNQTDDTNQGNRGGKLGFIAGAIQRERVSSFERMLWRVSRGNVFFRQADIEVPLKDPATGNEMLKSVFIVFFQGEELKTRVKKVCVGFHAKTHECPATRSDRADMLQGVKTRLDDLHTILKQTQEHRHATLMSVAKHIYDWKAMIKKMKAIYHIMNQLNVDITNKCLIAECWVPKLYISRARAALDEGAKVAGSTIKSFLNIIPTAETPPTFHKTNRFTKGFQNLIDAYGMASYREVNPAYFTTITFPFLFGVMFGDMGHGIILTLFGAWMTIWEKRLMKKKSKNEIWNIFFGGRYIILIMGLFSIYIGFIYNDFFSKSLNIFQSYWRTNYNETTIQGNKYLTLDPATSDYYQVPYPVGLDPVWQLAENKIIFLNTYKMKLSIIIGVIHMIFGVCLSVSNFTYFKKKVFIFTDFLPQVIFLILIFFYMVVMMFLKWVMYSAVNENKVYGTRCAPPVLILFINMILFTKSTPTFPNDCTEGYMFPNQQLLHLILMILAIICIPVMLIAKPSYLLCCRKKETKDIEASPNKTEVSDKEGEHGEEEEPASEIIIHQIIHTIEYVLSTISHTASYLRLWALSLAHAQLSDVLWSMVLRKGMRQSNYVGCITIYIAFAVWAFFTIAILVMMEGLSAFLHTLRLHWVEFMSKFYEGLGYPFQPFSFKVLMAESENDD